MPRPWWWTWCLLVLCPGVAAGTASDPEVTDPRGDLSYLGAPAPAGFAWADIIAAWFEATANDTVTLHLQVAGDEGPPAQGEIGVTFAVGDSYYIAGYTVVPPFYAGGFLSCSDEAGDVPDTCTPDAVAATWQGGLIVVPLPLDVLDPDAVHGALRGPNGWSESHATNGRTYRLDETAPGRDFGWTTAAPHSDPEPAPQPNATPAAPVLLLGLVLIGILTCSRANAK